MNDIKYVAKSATQMEEVEKIRINIMKIIQVRFKEIPQGVIQEINAIDDKSALKKLFTSSIIVADYEDFQKRLQAIVSRK
ncbi:MAG: hypothetical protein KI793_02825 [Rivularia sp. (in: Bacteria)]|nr:hypothetical protein [Rivularia sp. MS3]